MSQGVFRSDHRPSAKTTYNVQTDKNKHYFFHFYALFISFSMPNLCTAIVKTLSIYASQNLKCPCYLPIQLSSNSLKYIWSCLHLNSCGTWLLKSSIHWSGHAIHYKSPPHRLCARSCDGSWETVRDTHALWRAVHSVAWGYSSLACWHSYTCHCKAPHGLFQVVSNYEPDPMI